MSQAVRNQGKKIYQILPVDGLVRKHDGLEDRTSWCISAHLHPSNGMGYDDSANHVRCQV